MTNIRLAAVVVFGVLVQITVLTNVRIASIAPDLPFLLAVLAGLYAGAQRGAVFGFWIGLLYDVVLPSPLGLAALAAGVTAWIVGVGKEALIDENWGIIFAGAAVATGAAVGLFAVVGEVFGETGNVTGRLWLIMLVVGLTSLVLSPAARLLMRWCYGPLERV